MSKASFDSIGEFNPHTEEYLKGFTSGFAITASLVVDENGQTVNDSGNSKGIGDSVDLALLIALRKQADLVLTSGITFRNEGYKMPKNSDLAVFSRQTVDFSGLEVPGGRQAFWISPSQANGYLQALDTCVIKGYQGIHVEFGEQGVQELFGQGRIDALFLSSLHPDGLVRFYERTGLSPMFKNRIQGLSIGLVAWQQ